MAKIHWKPIRNCENSVWNNLPALAPNLEDFQELFESKRNTFNPIVTKSSSTEKTCALSNDRIRDISIMIKGMPTEKDLAKAIKSMDDKVIKRDCIDKLLKLAGYTEDIEAVKSFHQNNPDIVLTAAESFLLFVGSIKGLNARLNFWKFRKDCEASEKEICDPLYNLKTAMENLVECKEFHFMLSLALASGNYINKETAKGFQIEDLQKLKLTKDATKTKSLLYHIVRKAVEINKKFLGFDKEVVNVLESVSKTDFYEIKSGLEIMEKECNNALKYIIVHFRLNQDKDMGYSEFIRDVAERIITIKKIQEIIFIKYSQFLKWLGVDSSTNLKPQEMGKILFDFCSDVNKLKKEVTDDKKKTGLSMSKSMSYNPKYRDVMTKPHVDRSQSMSVTKPKQNTPNDDLANILNNSIGNAVLTKRVWKQPSSDLEKTFETEEDKPDEKATKDSRSSNDFSIGTEDELVDFLSDFTKNCQQRRRTVRRRPKLQK